MSKGFAKVFSKKPGFLALVLFLVLLLLCLLSLSLGAVHISFHNILVILSGHAATDDTATTILLYSRIPRILATLLTGSALAASGAIVQSVLQNPLASPAVIGVNSGAGFAVSLLAVLWPGAYALLPLASFLGAFAAVLLVLTISERSGASKLSLVLSGIAIGGIFSALIDAVVTFVPDALNGYADFKIGGFSSIQPSRLLPAGLVILLSFLLALSLCRALDVLSLGFDQAQSLGLPARSMRLLFLALAACLAGAAVSISGMLGFLGLMAPHIVRQYVGDEAALLLPFSAITGAILLLLCDLLSRLLFAPYEIPVGILLSLLGGPFFICLLLRQRQGRIHD